VQGISERTWWSRPGLAVRDGRLLVAERDAEGLAREHGTPVFVYDLPNVGEQAAALRDALDGAGLRGVVRLALKAQRDPAVLEFLRRRCPWVGLDVCSPGEVTWGLAHGWTAQEISYTGTNVSERDLDVILAAGVHLNVDLLSQIERVGRRAPGSTIGIRVNPRVGAGTSSAETKYAGTRATKFGLFQEQLALGLQTADRHGLVIDTVHVHAGDGYLTPGLDAFAETIRRVAAMTSTLQGAGCPIREVNTGGGLGVPIEPTDEPLDLERWAAVLAEHLGPLDVTVATEPGDFLVKGSGVLLAEVVTVEDRDGKRFVGLDAGWNQLCEHFVYGDRLEIVACGAADAPALGPATISGNINEGDDLFARDRSMPAIVEGDVLAILGVGSYNAAMASEHCLRPPAGSVAFAERAS